MTGGSNTDPLLAASPELSALVSLLRSAELTDVFIEGYVDAGDGVAPAHFGTHRGVRRFAPCWFAMYLELGDALVKLSVDEPTAGLRFERVAQFSMSSEVDPADEPAVTSISDLLFNLEGEALRVRRFEVVVGTPEQSRAGIVRAAGLAFPHRYSVPPERYLFFDPFNFDGIAVGRREERAAWLAAAPGAVVRSWSF